MNNKLTEFLLQYKDQMTRQQLREYLLKVGYDDRTIKKAMSKVFGGWRFLKLALIIVAIGAAIILAFAYEKKCQDISCFSDALKNCKSARYDTGFTQEASEWTIIFAGRFHARNCALRMELLNITVSAHGNISSSLREQWQNSTELKYAWALGKKVPCSIPVDMFLEGVIDAGVLEGC